MSNTSSASRYRAMLKRVAAELNVEVDSDKCEHVATMRLARRAVLARLLRNDMLRTDPDDLLKIDAALKAYQPPDKGLQIEVSFVESVRGTFKCSHCGEQNKVDGSYTSADKPLPQATFHCPHCNADSRHELSSTPFEPAPAPEAAPKGVSYREGVSASAIHSMVLPNDEIPPLKKEQPQIGASYAGNTVTELWRNDPNPTRNGAMAHQLLVNGKG
jgi:hypothetical protein